MNKLDLMEKSTGERSDWISFGNSSIELGFNRTISSIHTKTRD